MVREFICEDPGIIITLVLYLTSAVVYIHRTYNTSRCSENTRVFTYKLPVHVPGLVHIPCVAIALRVPFARFPL